MHSSINATHSEIILFAKNSSSLVMKVQLFKEFPFVSKWSRFNRTLNVKLSRFFTLIIFAAAVSKRKRFAHSEQFLPLRVLEMRDDGGKMNSLAHYANTRGSKTSTKLSSFWREKKRGEKRVTQKNCIISGMIPRNPMTYHHRQLGILHSMKVFQGIRVPAAATRHLR